MSIDQATLARRLKEARESSRISQEAAAEALGLPRTAVVHIEAGNRAISTLELVELAKLYQRDIATFFAEEEAKTEDNALLTLYRMDPLFRDNPKIQRSVSKCIDICREGTALEEILALSRRAGPPAYRLDAPRNPADAVQQGERIAVEERKRIGLGDAPVPDMADLIANQGVWASGAELPDEMSGLFLRHPSIGMVILVNFRHPHTRKRFSYAHEYAHCLLDRNQPVSVTTPETQNNLTEVRANAFAAGFLMPEGGVNFYLNSLDKGAPSRQTLHVYTPAGEHPAPAPALETERRPVPGSQKIVYQDVAQLANHFKASYAAAVYRLKNLDRISQTECTSLLKNDSLASTYLSILRLSDESSPPDRPDRYLINQVAYLAVEAFRRGEISRGRLLDTSKKLGIEQGNKLVASAKAAPAD